MSDSRNTPARKQVGDVGWRFDFEEGIDARQLAAWKWRAEEESSVRAVVVGQQSLLVVGDVDDRIFTRRASLSTVHSVEHEIVVSFREEYAPDLPLLLQCASLRLEEFLARVAQLRLRARFLGFLPGFAYLEGVPEEWSMPRRAAPRPRVPAGSFAVAGPMAGIYPIDSPGGWNLLGRTAVDLWRPNDAARPSLIAPGDVVRIVPTMDEIARFQEPRREAEGAAVARVLSPGQSSFIVGPPLVKRLSFGAPIGGPFDRELASRANRAVGNDAETPTLEIAYVGPTLQFTETALLAFAGELAPRVNGVEQRAAQITVDAGDVVDFGAVRSGARAYIALRGGWSDPEPVFATEPRALQRGDDLRRRSDDARTPSLLIEERIDRHVLRVRIGPDAVDDAALVSLLDASWIAGAGTRRGVRATPTSQTAAGPALLPSTPLIFGSVQWNPDGSLNILGPDHPVTGGYAQPFTLLSRELWKVAQLREGERFRFAVE